MRGSAKTTIDVTPLLLTSAEKDWLNNSIPTEQSISSAQHLVLLQFREPQQIETDLAYAKQLSQSQNSTDDCELTFEKSISSAQHLVLLQQRDAQLTKISLVYATQLPGMPAAAIDDCNQTELRNAIELSLQDLNRATASSTQHHNINTVSSNYPPLDTNHLLLTPHMHHLPRLVLRP